MVAGAVTTIVSPSTMVTLESASRIERTTGSTISALPDTSYTRGTVGSEGAAVAASAGTEGGSAGPVAGLEPGQAQQSSSATQTGRMGCFMGPRGPTTRGPAIASEKDDLGVECP
jgi:hypothetical protein